MSSTSAELAGTRVRRPAILRRVDVRAFARWQAVLLAMAAAGLLVYGLSSIAVSREHWPDIWMGDRMRLAAVVMLVAAVAIAAGLVARLPVLVLLGGAAVLWAALQQASAVGWIPWLLLPWAVSFTAAGMLIAATRLGRAYVALTVAGLAVFGIALVATRAWASIDFAIAAFATVLAWAVLDLAWRASRGTPLP